MPHLQLNLCTLHARFAGRHAGGTCCCCCRREGRPRHEHSDRNRSAHLLTIAAHDEHGGVAAPRGDSSTKHGWQHRRNPVRRRIAATFRCSNWDANEANTPSEACTHTPQRASHRAVVAAAARRVAASAPRRRVDDDAEPPNLGGRGRCKRREKRSARSNGDTAAAPSAHIK
jgi:hypothetical protein